MVNGAFKLNYFLSIFPHKRWKIMIVFFEENTSEKMRIFAFSPNEIKSHNNAEEKHRALANNICNLSVQCA